MSEKSINKFLAVLDRMSATKDRIAEIEKVDNEYYFRYAGHAFSIAQRNPADQFGSYSVYVYPQWPENRSLKILAKSFEDAEDPSDFPALVSYHELQVPEKSREKMAGLYAAVSGKHLRLDDVFDAILNEPP